MKRSLFDTALLSPLGDLTVLEQQALNNLEDIDSLYSLPPVIQMCSECVITNQRPRITINPDGVCNPCKYWKRKDQKIDWDMRQLEFIELCNEYRSPDGDFDVLVTSSGGKDSSYVAMRMRDDYSMHPLTVTWSPALYTEIGYQNFQNHIQHGLDNISATANGIVHRKLCRASTIVLGDPFQPFIYGQVNIPLRIAQAFGIGLIIDGENGEVEYGGDDSTGDSPSFNSNESEKYWQSGMPVDKWLDFGFTRKELKIYQPPKEAVSAERVFFSYYHNWKPHDNYYYASQHAGFMANPERSDCTYSRYASLDDAIDPFHYYFALLKFGIGRATADAAHEVREGVIDRDEALALVHRFDVQAPSVEATEIFMKYVDISEQQLKHAVKKWTNQRIWSKRDDFPALNFRELS